ncbi:hypothetical protein NP493_535g01036 [Ridgeia piscesae]|uniref:C3H1-type domain-containing protein n=1 Tax=Ridgeia piscesae TaxID=27915 RepID=A0AAD9NS03_RIDPI|nr:hypothetical protein NP493_535g01036 [Ridgeia piscesae]
MQKETVQIVRSGSTANLNVCGFGDFVREARRGVSRDVPMSASDGASNMSDNSDMSDDMGQRGGGGGGGGGGAVAYSDDICRDFLRNVCQRGKRCRYRHPPSVETPAAVAPAADSSTARRMKRRSTDARASCPGRLQQAVSLGIGLNSTEVPLLQGEVPICKDFLKGECKRGVRCKFRHVASSQSSDVIQEVGGSTHGRAGCVGSATVNERRLRTTISTMDTFESVYNDYVRCDYERSLKRRRIEEDFDSTYNGGYRAVVPTALDYHRLLEEDNILLRHKVEELKKQVSDLAATNEVLLEQNARFRAAKLTSQSNAPPTIVPMMTVTQVVTPTVAHAPVVARPTLGRPQFSQMATSLPQMGINANSGELVVPAVSQQALQTHLTNAVTVQPATMNTPVSVPLNPTNMVPVSIPLDTAMAAPGSIVAVSLGQTLQQQQQGNLTQTSLLNSGVTTALVSYPIMSHTQLPNSTLG